MAVTRSGVGLVGAVGFVGVAQPKETVLDHGSEKAGAEAVGVPVKQSGQLYTGKPAALTELENQPFQHLRGEAFLDVCGGSNRIQFVSFLFGQENAMYGVPGVMYGPTVVMYGVPGVMYGPTVVMYGPTVVMCGPTVVMCGPAVVMCGPAVVMCGVPGVMYGPTVIMCGVPGAMYGPTLFMLGVRASGRGQAIPRPASLAFLADAEKTAFLAATSGADDRASIQGVDVRMAEKFPGHDFR